MLGEKIGEFAGKTTSTRVLATNGTTWTNTANSANNGWNGLPQIEVSMQQNGVLLGVDCSDLGTFVATLQPGGYFEGQAQGILTTKDGEVATWTATGLGKPTGKNNAASWRGSVHYKTASQKLARLNGLCCVYEYETDENGLTQCKVSEWR